MFKPFAITPVALTLLGACDGKPLTFGATPLAAKRIYAESFQDTPFERGEISVISTEHCELHTFTLRPCGGENVCGSRKGHVVATPDYHVVTDAYAGRIFYISPGGDGWVKLNGTLYPVAWN